MIAIAVNRIIIIIIIITTTTPTAARNQCWPVEKIENRKEMSREKVLFVSKFSILNINVLISSRILFCPTRTHFT